MTGKKVVLVLAAVIGLMALLGCNNMPDPMHYELTEAEVSRINANSDFGEHKLLELYTGTESYPNDGRLSFHIESDNGVEVIGYYQKYPYSSDEIKLNHISIFTNRHNLLGIAVGDSVQKTKSLLEENKYEAWTNEEMAPYRNGKSYETIKYQKKNTNVVVTLNWDSDSDIITEIGVPVEDPTISEQAGVVY